MLDLGGVDELRLVVVANNAQLFRARLSQNNFAVLRGRVAGFAALFGEGRMHEARHQLGRRR